MIRVILIFGPPLVIAATMLSPQGLAYTVYAVIGYAGIMLLLLPLGAWPLFLIQVISPPPGQSRIQAVISAWLGGAVLSSAVINLLASMLEYSPKPLRFDPTGHELILYDPRSGFLLGAFALCMLLSTGCWGVLARVLPGGVALRGAVVTGLLLFTAVAVLGVRGVATATSDGRSINGSALSTAGQAGCTEMNTRSVQRGSCF